MAKYAYTFRQEIRHDGLNKYRVVTAKSRYELNQKVAAIQAQWEEQWTRKCISEQKKRELEARKRDKEQQKLDTEKAIQFAQEMTKDAEDSIQQIENLLHTVVNKLGPADMYDKTKFSIKSPIKPAVKDFPREPLRIDGKYNPPIPFL